MESVAVALAAGAASAALFWWLGRRLGWGDGPEEWLDPEMPRPDDHDGGDEGDSGRRTGKR